MSATVAGMMSLLFSVAGRMSRAGAWTGLAPLQLAAAGGAVAVAFGPAPAAMLFAPFALLALWATVAVAIKRCHDRGQSAWLLLWLLLVVATGASAVLMDAGALATWGGSAASAGAGLVAFAIVYLLPGQADDNRFGPPPRRTASVEQAPSIARAVSFWPAAERARERTPARRAERRCKPVPQSFRGLKDHATALIEPPRQPPGGRSNFGLRGV